MDEFAIGAASNATVTSLSIEMSYDNTNFTRKYDFLNLSADEYTGAKDRIKAINVSLAGGTAGGLSDFFVADDYVEGEQGRLSKISAAELKTVETYYVFGGSSAV